MVRSTIKNKDLNAGNSGRQFIEAPTKKVISQSTKDFIDKLLLSRISLAGIATVQVFGEVGLQQYVNT